MVQTGALLKVVDNSGARYVKCIKVYKKHQGSCGDFILVSATATKRRKLRHINLQREKKPLVLEHKLYRGFIVGTTKMFSRLDGSSIKFFFNNVVLLSFTKDSLLGTRILVPLLKEFRQQKFMKFLMLSSKRL